LDRPGFNDVEQLYIDPVECIDCGACIPVCPVSAIFAFSLELIEPLVQAYRLEAERNA